jgi:hypothetical protein
LDSCRDISLIVFGKRPESFDTIDIDLAVNESFPVIDSHMTKSIREEIIITSEFIGVNEVSLSVLTIDGRNRSYIVDDVIGET